MTIWFLGIMDANMRKNLILIPGIILIFLSGCETVLNNADDLTNIAIANDQIQSGQVSVVIKSAPLTDTEKLMVDHALNEYIAFAERWKASIINIDSTTPLFATFTIEYAALVSQYKTVENIVAQHWQEYLPLNQQLLTDYQLRAKKVNAAVDGLIAAGARYQAILDAITLAKILAGIAIKP